MTWPRISIVTPSYNQGKYIERTVRSVLLQRYPKLEYILMDGGSTDDTLERIAPYKGEFSYFVSEPDGGQAEAIANGFSRSSGEIMAYLNSDDLLAPSTLHFVARYFRDHPNIDWIYSHRCTVDDDDRVIWYWILPPHENFLMRRWDYIPQETCFWRRSLFEKTGNIDRSYRFAMDYDLFVRFMSKGRGRRLNRFLGAFRDHSASKTKQLLATIGAQEMVRVRQKYMIRASITDGIFGLLLGNWVQYVGRYFAAAAHSLPGGLPGVGYDYNDVWGGLLRPGEERVEPGSVKAENDFYSPLCPVTLGLADRLLFEITSTRAGHSTTNKIYLNSKSRVAIIAPSAKSNLQGGFNDLSLAPHLASQHSGNAVNAEFPRWRLRLASMFEAVYRFPSGTRRADLSGNDSTVEQILWLTRGLVSTNNEIAFLDIGCSNGALLDALKTRTKWNLSGLEASASAAAEALAKGHRVFQTTLHKAAGLTEFFKGFDVIYLGQGVQCFDDPRASLRAVAVLLNTGGLVVVGTPNLDSEQRKLFGAAWALWKPEEYRFIYGRRSLTQMMAQTGFAMAKFITVSQAQVTTLSLKRFDEISVSPSISSMNMQSGRQVAAVSRPFSRFWDKIGRGDIIFAVFRKVF